MTPVFLEMRMKIAIYIGKKDAEGDNGLKALLQELTQAGYALDIVREGDRLADSYDMLLSVGIC